MRSIFYEDYKYHLNAQNSNSIAFRADLSSIYDGSGVYNISMTSYLLDYTGDSPVLISGVGNISVYIDGEKKAELTGDSVSEESVLSFEINQPVYDSIRIVGSITASNGYTIEFDKEQKVPKCNTSLSLSTQDGNEISPTSIVDIEWDPDDETDIDGYVLGLVVNDFSIPIDSSCIPVNGARSVKFITKGSDKYKYTIDLSNCGINYGDRIYFTLNTYENYYCDFCGEECTYLSYNKYSEYSFIHTDEFEIKDPNKSYTIFYRSDENSPFVEASDMFIRNNDSGNPFISIQDLFSM